MFQYVCETSPGKNAIFSSIYLLYLHHRLLSSFGLQFVTQPYPAYICLIQFLFVRPEVCLKLPSDSISRWTPLFSAVCLVLLTCTKDFHLLDCTHAGRTLRRIMGFAQTYHMIILKQIKISKSFYNFKQSLIKLYLNSGV